MEWPESVNRFLTPRRISYGLITGGALWLTWLVSITFGKGNFDLTNNVIGTDYLQFYTAGLTLRTGDGENLYDFNFQIQLQDSIAGQQTDALRAFITPPFLAWLYLPFSAFPYLISFLLWSVFSLAALWLSFIWLGLEKPVREYVWALSWFPVFASISFGQNSLLSLVILSLTYFIWNSNKKLVAGVIISLLLYKPQLILGVGFLWVLRWRQDWKCLLGLILGGSFIAILSDNFLPQANSDYVSLSRSIFPQLLSFEGFPLWHAHTVRAFIILLFPGQILLSYIIWGVISIIAFLAFIYFWRIYRDNRPNLFAGAICLMILITPHAMIYDWVLLLIPAVLLWENQPKLRQFLIPTFAVIWIVTIISGSISYLLFGWISRAVQISIPVYLIVLVNIYIVTCSSYQSRPE